MPDEPGRAPSNAGGQPARRHGRPRRGPAWCVRAVAAAVLALTDPGHCGGPDESLHLHLAQVTAADALKITVAPTVTATAAAQAPMPIAVGPSGALPTNGFVRVRGLPPTVSLSAGYVTAPGAWSVPINALSALKMIVPAGVAGSCDLSIGLVAEDGTLLAETKAVLVVTPPPQSAPPAAPKAVPADLARQDTPSAAHMPILSPADRDAAERLIARGEREMEQGGVAVARQFFLRATQAGLARGALLLAATYDPRELARSGVQGVQPNIAEARKWYEKARELGAPEAEERLARLGGG